jgi:2-dehydro-3-deoxygluconokinase
VDHVSAVTIGESLGLVRMTGVGPIAPGSAARVSFAGAESNVAIGLARLGHSVAYVSRVGADAVGRMAMAVLRGEQVDVSHVAVDPELPTALMVREQRTSDLHQVAYFRTGSAGSRLAPDDVPADLITRADLMHVSGITLGLSSSARDAVRHAISLAHGAGRLVSLDVNHRSALWSAQDAGSVLRPLLGQVDIVFGGDEELSLLCAEPTSDVAQVAQAILAAGPNTVVHKRGAAGAAAYDASGRSSAAAVPATMVDPVGAGDAFVAGYLSAVLDGEPVQACLRRATACGAFCVSVPGDWEGLPRREELEMLSLSERVRR